MPLPHEYNFSTIFCKPDSFKINLKNEVLCYWGKVLYVHFQKFRVGEEYPEKNRTELPSSTQLPSHIIWVCFS